MKVFEIKSVQYEKRQKCSKSKVFKMNSVQNEVFKMKSSTIAQNNNFPNNICSK